MTTTAETYTLTGAIVACWLVFVARLVNALFGHAFGQETPESAYVVKWSIWSIPLFVILAATANHPLAIRLFGQAFGDWFGTIPRTVFSVLAYIIGGNICLRFLPTYKLFRWDWPLIAGLLTIGAYSFILMLASTFPDSFPYTLEKYRSAVADSALHSFILVSTACVILPALSWRRRLEKYLTMRLRFLFLTITYLLIVIWMVNDIAMQLFLAMGWPYQLHLVIHPIANGGVAALFMLSFFAPPEFYLLAAKPINYVVYLLTYACLRWIEYHACNWTGQEISKATLLEILRSPDNAIYLSVIAILDARKILKAHQDVAARDLAARLEIAAQSHLELSEVVIRLRRIGRDYLIGSVIGATAT